MSPLIQLVIILEFISPTIAFVKFTFLNKGIIILIMITLASFHMALKAKQTHGK